MKWWKGALGLERDAPSGQKDILPWRGGALSTENGDNFVRNQATIAEVSDTIRQGGRNALGLSATWACINLIAGTIASLPLLVYRRENGINRPAPDHPLYWLLHEDPNFDQTAVDFWEYMVAGIELQGNAYAEIKRGSGGVTSLIPIRPDGMSVQRLSSGNIEYRWHEGGKEVVRSYREVLHIRGPLGDALSGVSTLTACRGAFDAAIAADSASETIFANGIRPSGILSTDPSVSLTVDQRQDFERLLTEKFRGALNAGRPMLLDRGMKWSQLDMSPEDAQMIETRGWGVEEICRIFSVPPHLVGHMAGNTQLGSSIEEQTLGFVKFHLRKRLKRIEKSVGKQLLTRAERQAGLSVEFNLEGLLRGDHKSRSEFYESGLKNKWRTINEVRAFENEPPVPWGDRPWGQEQDIQLQEDGSVPPADRGQEEE